ncbi:ComF family protein [Massilia glaciei]|uniref:ComF family protein n=1 Tax=Massilia glaciei TaxID=1524097 RepID=A0A2U2HK38_9BURK|nr:ComF family protein [Massilia glaciei]PWF47878.1 ComF family protein [Massilia glaciei]
MTARLRLPSLQWSVVAAALARALLPSSCALCGARSDACVCAPCHAQFIAPRRARCKQCANPLAAFEAGLRCAACLVRRPAYDATVAAADYAAPVDQLLLQLKFGGQLALAPWFAQAIAASVRAQAALLLPNVLCPVPLGPRRLQERGFNQALEIARPLARALGIPLRARLAIRARETAAQSSVAPQERVGNLRNAFIIAPEALAMVRGQHVGLVDDVMTSGHTLDELAATFKRFGAARVSNFVFARTPPH